MALTVLAKGPEWGTVSLYAAFGNEPHDVGQRLGGVAICNFEDAMHRHDPTIEWDPGRAAVFHEAISEDWPGTVHPDRVTAEALADWRRWPIEEAGRAYVDRDLPDWFYDREEA